MNNEEYIGDGLYTSFNGFEFTLRAPREGGDHYVVLDMTVYANFNLYAAKMLRKKQIAVTGVANDI
jgi:hypothetical protein